MQLDDSQGQGRSLDVMMVYDFRRGRIIGRTLPIASLDLMMLYSGQNK